MLPNNVNVCNVGNIKNSSNDKLSIIFYYDFFNSLKKVFSAHISKPTI